MRVASYAGGFGRVEGDRLVRMGGDITDWLAGGPAVDDGEALALDAVRLTAPVTRPGKILCVGVNYRDHARESGLAVPTVPIIFGKYANSVTGPGDEVFVPAAATGIDYEAELGVVIGRSGRALAVDEALGHVAGYVCVNDLSSRSLQFETSQWLMGKAIDGFLPMGPWLVTPEEVPDPQQLRISCRVNGELRQDSSTAEMVFSVAEIVAFVSRVMTLEPGDVIATGTPAGVGMGQDPARYLEDGDEVTVEIEGLGRLTNVIRLAAAEGGRR